MQDTSDLEPSSAFAGPAPSGRRGEIAPSAPLPIEGSVEVAMAVARLWSTFLDVPGWSRWNSCIWRSSLRGGELRGRNARMGV